MEKNNVKTWVLIGAAVVILAGILIYAQWGSLPRPGQPAAPMGVPTYAPQGQVVAGFPKQLILDPAAAVSNSYSINYTATTNQYTAQWNSSSAMNDLYVSYKQYLTANGWTITSDNAKYSGSRGLYARNASSDVSVVVIAQGNGSQVTVTYLAK